MIRYKLLKDLPFAKAGDIFKGELEYGTTILFPEYYENYKHKLSSDEFWDFDEWFEEVKKPEQYFTIDILKSKVSEVMKVYHAEWAIKNMKSLGLLFETQEEAEKYLVYLKAKVIIKNDTKGFKPNWHDVNEKKYHGIWDFERGKINWVLSYAFKEINIYFKSQADILGSFDKHPKEWETYLTYEQ